MNFGFSASFSSFLPSSAFHSSSSSLELVLLFVQEDIVLGVYVDYAYSSISAFPEPSAHTVFLVEQPALQSLYSIHPYIACDRNMQLQKCSLAPSRTFPLLELLPKLHADPFYSAIALPVVHLLKHTELAVASVQATNDSFLHSCQRILLHTPSSA